jgi:prephenate dehydrogenase
MRPDSLAVIGLGPVGGSIAWAALRAGVPRVVGSARNRGDAVQALKAGAVHEIADRAELAVCSADLVVLADPGADQLVRLAAHFPGHATITTIADLATPAAAAAVQAGVSARWASSHPLRAIAGEGFAAARPDPFTGSVVYVAPADRSGDQAVREVMHFWNDVLGAEPVRIEVADHDERLGWMEHLPRLLATAVASAYASKGLGAATWGSDARALTDLALADPTRSAELLMANRDVVRAAVRATAGALEALGAAIDSGDRARVIALLESARRVRREGVA